MNNTQKSNDAWIELENNLSKLELLVEEKTKSVASIKDTAKKSIEKIDNLITSLSEVIK